MALGIAKVTSQGQISVPVGVRKKLSIVPGSLLEFEERGDEVVVRRKGIYTFDDLHKRLFPNGPPKPAPTIEQMKEAVGRGIAERYRKAVGKVPTKSRARR